MKNKKTSSRKKRSIKPKMNYYVPANLSLETLLKELGNEELQTQIDRMYHFVHIVFTKQQESVLESEEQITDSFVNLKAQYIREDVGRSNYIRIKRFLLENGVIETDGKAIRGKKSYGFRIGREYADSGTRVIQRSDSIARNARPEGAHRKQGRLYNLDEHLHELKFDLDGALKAIDSFLENRITIKDGIVFSKKHHIAYSYIAKRFASDVTKPFRDEASGRLHSKLTILPKRLRTFVSHPLGQLIQLDIANSQYLLINVLLNKEQRKDKALINHNDVMLYRQLTESGGFYEYMMKVFNEAGIPCKSIKESKNIILKKTFFTQVNTMEFAAFENKFPKVALLVLRAKRIRKKKNHFATRLQKLEARIILDSICRRMKREHPRLFIATLHDSIVTLEQHADLVHRIMKEEFQRKYEMTPKLTIKSFDEFERTYSVLDERICAAALR